MSPALPRVRLAGACPADVSAVRRQLGPVDDAGDPGVVVTFVDGLASGSPAELSVEGPAGPWRLTCRRGLGRVPFLVEAVRLACLGAGVLPLHAAAFSVDGAGVAVTGWTGSGKTGALLAFLSGGASHIAAEWVLIEDGQGLRGIAQPVRVRDWHLRQLPGLWSRLPRGDRARLRLLRAATGTDGPARRRIEGRLQVDLAPNRLPGPEGGAEPGLRRLFVVEAAAAATPEVRRLDPAEAAERVVSVLEHDLLGVRAECLRARCRGRPELGAVVDDMEERQRRLVGRSLAGHEVLLVRHRHRGSLAALHAAMRPHVQAGP